MIADKKPISKIQAQKNEQMKKKEDQILNAVTTLKNNPKFIKLLVYGLNSLDSYLTPPNREIRLNAKIIIRFDGIGVLKLCTMMNLTNDEIVEKTGIIIYKLIGINDIVDQELAKYFVEANGHEAVIEILLSLQPGPAAKNFVKVLNGLVQIPQLTQKLIDAGLIEAVKLINDLYADDIEIININFDTIKKISNLKIGREFLLDKKLIPNLLKNISIAALHKDVKAVVTGFSIVDNLSKSDLGKEELKKNGAIDHISKILDHFENDDKVLQMGSKIYSKIATKEDMLFEIEKLRKIYEKKDYSDLQEANKSMMLISNLMIVDELGKLLLLPENMKLLQGLFQEIMNISLSDKTPEYIKTYVILNKCFMTVFNRLQPLNPDLFADINFLKAVNKSISTVWNSVKRIMQVCGDDLDQLESFMTVFKDFYSSYTDVYEQTHKIENPIGEIIDIINENNKYFKQDEKYNNASSRMIQIANKSSDPDIRKKLVSLIDYIKDIVNVSEVAKTLDNVLKVLKNILRTDKSLINDNITECVYQAILDFMGNKPKLRSPNYHCLQILDLKVSSPGFLEQMKENKESDKYIGPVISVLTGHIFNKSNVLRVVNLGSGWGKVDSKKNQEHDARVENKINIQGPKILEKLLDENDVKKYISQFKDCANSFSPSALTSGETLRNLETSILNMYCLLKTNKFKNLLMAPENLEALKQLLKKDIAFIEGFKRDKNNEKNNKFDEICNLAKNRIKMELGMLKQFGDNCKKTIETAQGESEKLPILGTFKEVEKTILEVFEKYSDADNLNDLVLYIKDSSNFILDNEKTLNSSALNEKKTNSLLSVFQEKKFENVKFEDSVIEKLCNTLMNLLRRSLDDDRLCENIIDTFLFLTKKKAECCNYLVKAGCPRLLMQLIEGSSNVKLCEKSLQLIKVICQSSTENVEMVSKQDILEKIVDIRSKFINNSDIQNSTRVIINELNKLPGHEDIINKMILNNAQEIDEIIKSDKIAENSIPLLNNLEKINVFTPKPEKAELLADKEFIKNVGILFDAHIHEKKEDDTNEKLLINELNIKKKIFEKSGDLADLKDIIESCLKIIKGKPFYRELYLAALKTLNKFVNDDKAYSEVVEKLLDESLINALFDNAENYVDDAEVTKEVNNLLSSLCMKNKTLCQLIIDKGGLANVMEELKGNSKLTDEAANNAKLNGLKFIYSLIKDEKQLDKFLNAGGLDLIHNIIKTELDDGSEEKTDVLYYATRETFSFNVDMANRTKDEVENKNPNVVYCFKIINQVVKVKKVCPDIRVINDIVSLLDKNYPNNYLFSKGMKIFKNIEGKYTLEAEARKNLSQIILSHIAHFLYDEDLRNLSIPVWQKVCQDDDLKPLEIIQTCISDSSKADDTYKNYINDNENLMRFLCFEALVCESEDTSLTKLPEDAQKTFCYFIAYLAMNLKNILKSPGAVIAALKIFQTYFDQLANKNIIETKITVDDVDDFILASALKFYIPENYIFIQTLLNHFNKMYAKVGKVPELLEKENYVFFLQNIYLRSFEVFEYYNELLKTDDAKISEKLEEAIVLIKDIVKIYLACNKEKNIKSSTLKRLANICGSITLNEELPFEKSKPFWEILEKLLETDDSRTIAGNNELVNSFLNKIKAALSNPETKDNEILRNILVLFSKNIEGGSDISEKLLRMVESDLEDNKDLSDNFIAKDLSIIKNLITNPIIAKSVLNSPTLLPNLNKIYNEKADDKNIRGLIAQILSNLTAGNSNNYALIEKSPDILKKLNNNLKENKLNLQDPIDRKIVACEIDAFVQILTDNSKTLNDKNIITSNDIDAVVNNFNNDEEFGNKLKNVRDLLNSMNKEKMALESLEKDKKDVKVISAYINKCFEDDMNKMTQSGNMNGQQQDDSNLIRTSTVQLAKMETKSKTKAANLFEAEEKEAKENKVKSALSSRDNPEIGLKIDQILALLIKLYRELVSETDEKILTEKNLLITELLGNIKVLSMNPDNYKSIIGMGLSKFMETLYPDRNLHIRYYLDSLEITKNCTTNDSGIALLLTSSICDNVIDEVVRLYDNPEEINQNSDVKHIFGFSNSIFSNLCKSKDGFNYLYNKIGLDKLLRIAKMTNNLDILSAILQAIVNYLQSGKDYSAIVKDIMEILNKCLNIKDKTSTVMSKLLLIGGLIYSPQIIDQMKALNLVKIISSDFDKFIKDTEFLNSMLFCLGKITINNVGFCRDTLDTGLLTKIKNIIPSIINNVPLIENVTNLYGNLLINNLESIEKFCKTGQIAATLMILEKYSDSDNNQIPLNCIVCLDSLTVVDKAIQFIADTKFSIILFNVLDKKLNEPHIIKYSLHLLSNYVYKEIGNNLKSLNFEQVLQMLINVQKKYYSNSDILINVNKIAGSLIKLMKEKAAKEKLFQIISESMKIQDWYAPLILMAMKITYEVLTTNPTLIDDIFEDNMLVFFNILKNHSASAEIQFYCYRTFSLFAKNPIYSYMLVNNGLMDYVKSSIDNTQIEPSKKEPIKVICYELSSIIAHDPNNAKIVSEILMDNIIQDSTLENTHLIFLLKLIYNLTRHKQCVEPFIAHKGLDTILEILRNSSTNVNIIYDCFNILGNIIEGSDDYKKMMLTLNVTDLINKIIDSSSFLDKKIEYEGRTLIFNINSHQAKLLEKVEDINILEMKSTNVIKQEVKNFLINGKILTMINEKGDVKPLHLSMSSDLMKISAKKPKKNLPPKPKYTLETIHIKQIVKGHGTDAFKKSSGFFRSIPDPKKCLTIIGPTTTDGVRALNIEFETEEEVNKWVEYLEIVINFFRKNQTIRNAVVIKKNG